MEKRELARFIPWRAIGLGLAALSIIVATIANRHGVHSGAIQLAHLHPAALLAGLLAVGLGVVNRGAHAQAAYRLMALPSRLIPMVELTATSYATNKLVKAAGVAGIVPFLADARTRGHERERVIGAYLCMSAAASLAQAMVILVAVGVGFATGVLDGAVRLGAAAAIAYCAATVGSLALVAGNGPIVRSIVGRATLVADRARTAFGRAPSRSDGTGAGCLGSAALAVRHQPIVVARLVTTALTGKLIGACTLAVVLAGLGVHLPVGTILVVYTLTLVASAAGPLPAGIGTAEASLAALLVGNGVGAETAGAAVVAFRLLDVWLPIALVPIGRLARSSHTAARRPGRSLPLPVPAVAVVGG